MQDEERERNKMINYREDTDYYYYSESPVKSEKNKYD